MSHIAEKEWTTENGFPASVLVVHDSHRCGYIGVPKGHPLFGVEYGSNVFALREKAQSCTIGKKSPILVLTAECDALGEGEVRCSPDVLIDCHGGITYSGGTEFYPSETVKDHWWFGFDCAHYGDGSMDTERDWAEGPVRSLEYCINECESMARQISELFPSSGAGE